MILPAVLEIDPKKQIQRMEELGKYSSIIHTDIMDGKFVKGKNLNVLKALIRYKSPVDLELHLMVEEPEKLFFDIRKIKNVKCIIVQVESDWKPAFKKFKKYYKVGVAFKPETPVSLLVGAQDFVPLHGRWGTKFPFDFIQLLAITPGAQGNPFRPEIYRRVKEVKKIFPGVPIEIDGALNPLRIKKLRKLGASDFVVGSYLKSGDVKRKIEILCKI